MRNFRKGPDVTRFAIQLAVLAALAALIPACGGSGGGTPVQNAPVPGPTPPAPYHGLVNFATPGANSIVARGGNSTGGKGGNGAQIQINNLGGSDAKILRAGSINTDFVVPDATPSLGTNPRTISVDTTLSVGSGLTAGVASILGDDNATVATGLWIQPGVTLTVNPNFPVAAPRSNLQLGFGDCVLIEGTLRVGDYDGFPGYKVPFFMSGNGTILIRDTGMIDGAGETTGGGGGGFGAYITLFSYGTIINHGTIRSRGGDGTTGGPAGYIALESGLWGVYNTGLLDAQGGAGTAGAGGPSAGAYFYPSYFGGSFTGGGSFNSGDVITRGGSGTTGGGNGGVITMFFVDSDGPRVSSGLLDSSGGNVPALGGSGNGGNAGAIRVNATGGHTRVSGKLLARGGNGAGATGNGGNGAYIEVTANSSGSQVPGAGVYLGAVVDSSGGNGVLGGNAGPVDCWNNSIFPTVTPLVSPGDTPVILAGFTSLDASGGDNLSGAVAGAGGDAGSIWFRNYCVPAAGGNIVAYDQLNEADFGTRGGDSNNGAGGLSGGIYIGLDESFGDGHSPKFDRVLENRGSLTTHGGRGTTTGSAGGGVTLFDWFTLKNSGSIITTGGAGGTGNGGLAGVIIMRTDSTLLNTGTLFAQGGASATGTGGNGGQVTLDGQTTTQQGTISARGGARTDVSAGNGGNGGSISISSWNGVSLSTVVGTLGVQGGFGTTNGLAGLLLIDGLALPLINGSVTLP